MRRKDREITDRETIQSVIRKCHCCRLGFFDNGSVYIVPLSFGYEEVDGTDVFYFHGAPEGRKMDCIRTGGPVGFELDTGYGLHPAETACAYSAAFESVIGTGRVSLIEGDEEKRHGLRCIMAQYVHRSDWEFSQTALDHVAVFRLEVTELSCKVHL